MALKQNYTLIYYSVNKFPMAKYNKKFALTSFYIRKNKEIYINMNKNIWIDKQN